MLASFVLLGTPSLNGKDEIIGLSMLLPPANCLSKLNLFERPTKDPCLGGSDHLEFKALSFKPLY